MSKSPVVRCGSAINHTNELIPFGIDGITTGDGNPPPKSGFGINNVFHMLKNYDPFSRGYSCTDRVNLRSSRYDGCYSSSSKMVALAVSAAAILRRKTMTVFSSLAESKRSTGVAGAGCSTANSSRVRASFFQRACRKASSQARAASAASKRSSTLRTACMSAMFRVTLRPTSPSP